MSDTWIDEPPDTLVEKLRMRLLDAAAWSSAGASRVAMLVGGVDSSGILGALVQTLPRDRIVAFTITGTQPDRDADLPYVEELCQQLGVVLHRFEWSPDRHPIEEGLLVDERPAYTPCFTQAWVRELADLGVDRLISASNGDALFGAEMNELAYRVVSAPFSASRAFLAKMPWRSSVRTRARWMFAEHVAPVQRRRWRARMPRYWGPRLRERIAAPLAAPRMPRDRIVDWYSSPSMVSSLLFQQAFTRGFAMTHRDATLHPPLVSLLASIPVETLNCDGRYRGLYHRAIRPWVSPKVRARTGKSYVNPLAVLPSRTESVLRDLARGTALEREGYVVGAELALAFEQPAKREALWTLLAAEAWLRRCN